MTNLYSGGSVLMNCLLLCVLALEGLLILPSSRDYPDEQDICLLCHVCDYSRVVHGCSGLAH